MLGDRLLLVFLAQDGAGTSLRVCKPGAVARAQRAARLTWQSHCWKGNVAGPLAGRGRARGWQDTTVDCVVVEANRRRPGLARQLKRDDGPVSVVNTSERTTACGR